MSEEKSQNTEESFSNLSDVYGSLNNCGFNCIGQGIIDFLCHDEKGKYDPSQLRAHYEAEPNNGPIHALMHTVAVKYDLPPEAITFDLFERLFIRPKEEGGNLDYSERQCLWGDILRFHFRQIQEAKNDHPIYGVYQARYRAKVNEVAPVVPEEATAFRRMGQPGIRTSEIFLKFFCKDVLNIDLLLVSVRRENRPISRSDLSENREKLEKTQAYTESLPERKSQDAKPYMTLRITQISNPVASFLGSELGSHWTFHTRNNTEAKQHSTAISQLRVASRKLGLSREQNYDAAVRAEAPNSLLDKTIVDLRKQAKDITSPIVTTPLHRTIRALEDIRKDDRLTSVDKLREASFELSVLVSRLSRKQPGSSLSHTVQQGALKLLSSVFGWKVKFDARLTLIHEVGIMQAEYHTLAQVLNPTLFKPESKREPPPLEPIELEPLPEPPIPGSST